AVTALPALYPELTEPAAWAQTGTCDQVSATFRATPDEDGSPNSVHQQALTSGSKRNHNPRVGGSSPSAAIFCHQATSGDEPCQVRGCPALLMTRASRSRVRPSPGSPIRPHGSPAPSASGIPLGRTSGA